MYKLVYTFEGMNVYTTYTWHASSFIPVPVPVALAKDDIFLLLTLQHPCIPSAWTQQLLVCMLVFALPSSVFLLPLSHLLPLFILFLWTWVMAAKQSCSLRMLIARADSDLILNLVRGSLRGRDSKWFWNFDSPSLVRVLNLVRVHLMNF